MEGLLPQGLDLSTTNNGNQNEYVHQPMSCAHCGYNVNMEPFRILLGTPEPLMLVVADAAYVLKELYGMITTFFFLLVQNV